MKGPLHPNLKAFHAPISTCWWIRCYNLSEHNMKIYGEKESPCLIPLAGRNLSATIQFHNTLGEFVSMHAIIRATISRGIPASTNVSLIKSQFNLSQAFSKSTFVTIKPFLPLFRLRIESITSWATMILSTVCLPGTKLHWLFVTRKVIRNEYYQWVIDFW